MGMCVVCVTRESGGSVEREVRGGVYLRFKGTEGQLKSWNMTRTNYGFKYRRKLFVLNIEFFFFYIVAHTNLLQQKIHIYTW